MAGRWRAGLLSLSLAVFLGWVIWMPHVQHAKFVGVISATSYFLLGAGAMLLPLVVGSMAAFFFLPLREEMVYASALSVWAYFVLSVAWCGYGVIGEKITRLILTACDGYQYGPYVVLAIFYLATICISLGASPIQYALRATSYKFKARRRQVA